MDEVVGTKARPSGPVAAAAFSAAFGLLVLALVHIATEFSAAFKDTVFAIGKAWIPGAAGIGPYSGKETLMFLAWLGSWTILFFALRAKDVNLRAWFGTALVMLLAATLLLWPPVWHLLLGK